MDAVVFSTQIVTLGLRYSFSVTSWIRSGARNRRVGGNPNSRHLLGLAVDVVLDRPADTKVFMSDCRRLGLRAIDEGDHIHVQAT